MTTISVPVDRSVFPIDVVQRAAHAFSGRCFVSIRAEELTGFVIELANRDETDDLRSIAGEFSNALIDFQLRASIAAETHVIRELIVAQAFCEADLLDREDANASTDEDPRRIAGGT